MNRILPSLRGARRVIVFGIVLTLVAIAGTFLLDPYRNFQLATIAASFCAVAGLTLLVGHSGQLSLGHAALMAAGGYGYALTANALATVDVDPLLRSALALVAGVACAGVLGLLLGLAAARLRGPYLAGVTLTLVIALPAITSVFSGVFRGDQGIQTPYDGVPEVLRTIIALEQWQAWIAILIAGACATWLAVLRGGVLGLRMRAVRDDEIAARLSGVASSRVKVLAFVVSAVTAGAGGAVLCFITQSVSPGAYTLAFSLLLLVAAVLGGLGSLGGAAIGATLIVLLPWLIGTVASAIPMPTELAQRLSGNLSVLVFGALLIITMIVRPGGLASLRFRSALSEPKKEVTHVTAPSAPADRDPRHGDRPGDRARRLQHTRPGGS
nr:branched-chain amino acid ABC transporter permease [Microbacterium hydrocarbonoxydans]